MVLSSEFNGVENTRDLPDQNFQRFKKILAKKHTTETIVTMVKKRIEAPVLWNEKKQSKTL